VDEKEVEDGYRGWWRRWWVLVVVVVVIVSLSEGE
jgi:hypothetical protein